MKKVISLLIIGVVLVVQAALLYAATSVFSLTATISGITGSSISAQTVTPPPPGTTGTTVWAPVTGTALSFDPLTLQTYTVSGVTYQAFAPNHYFAIDIAGTGGAGTPSTTLNYVEGTSPTGSTSDQKLGNRANITYRALKYNPTGAPTEYVITSHMGGLLRNVINETITPAQVTGTTGSWLRVYLGLNNGQTSGQTPFSPADPAGVYTGQLTITSTP